MKSKLIASALILSSMLYQNSASAAVPSVDGWYYTTIQYITVNGLQQVVYDQMGAYSSEYACNQAYDADFGDGGAIPYAGSPGCFLLYTNEIGPYAELLDLWNSPRTGNIQPDVRHNMNEVLASVGDLTEQHRIKEYREAVIKLSTPKR